MSWLPGQVGVAGGRERADATLPGLTWKSFRTGSRFLGVLATGLRGVSGMKASGHLGPWSPHGGKPPAERHCHLGSTRAGSDCCVWALVMLDPLVPGAGTVLPNGELGCLSGSGTEGA